MIDVDDARCAILTTGFFGSILPPMLHRLSSMLLVACLIGLSGIDLLDDLRRPAYSHALRSPAAQMPQFGQSQNLANDIIESAGRPRPLFTSLLDASRASADRDRVLLSAKRRPLHKLNHVYLI